MLRGGILEGVVDQGDAKVFGWKGAIETEDTRDMVLDRRNGVEEKDLGFILVAVQAEASEKV